MCGLLPRTKLYLHTPQVCNAALLGPPEINVRATLPQFGINRRPSSIARPHRVIPRRPLSPRVAAKLSSNRSVTRVEGTIEEKYILESFSGEGRGVVGWTQFAHVEEVSLSLSFTLFSHPFRLQSSSSSFDTLFPLYSNFSRRQDRSRLSYSFDYRRVYVPSLLLFIDKEFRRFDEGRFISELYPSSSPTESLLFLPPARIKASWLGNFCAHIRTETPRGGTDGQSSKGGEEGKGRRNE